jgi:hypothetical protein
MDRMEAMFHRLTRLITESFNTTITKLVSAIDEKTNVKIDVQASEIYALSNKVSSLEKRIDDVTNINTDLLMKLTSLTQENQRLAQAMDNLEQHSRADSLLIHGLPLPSSGATEDLYSLVPSTLNNLIPTVHLTSEMISVVHRLPAQSATNQSSAVSRPPPVVVRFARRQVRATLMSNRKLLKGKNLVLSDHLTPARASLLKRASALVTANKILAAWSQDGKILVKNQQNRTVQLYNETDLAQFH